MGILGAMWGLRRTEADAPDWQRARGNIVGRKVGLQPWRFLEGLPAGTRVTTIEKAVPTRPAPLVDYYDDHPERGAGTQVTLKGGKRRSYDFKDVLVLRGHVFMDPKSSRIARLPFYQSVEYPHPGLEVVEERAALTVPVNREMAQRIDGPVLVADARHTGYGHLLIEVVPRLGHLKHLPAETKVLTGFAASKARIGLFEALGVPQEEVIQLNGPAMCRQAFALDNPMDLTGFISDDCWAVYDRIKDIAKQAEIAPVDRLFISRQDIWRRKLRNELEIQDLFARYGFAIVQPEKLSMRDQVKLFANASIIAGARGSAMHNVVFARPETRMLLLTHRRFIPALDNILMRQDRTLAIALGEPEIQEGRELMMPWSIQTALVERALKSHFGL